MTDMRGEEAPTWGKKMRSIVGPYTEFQRRVSPDGEFSQIDREWRKKWNHDQTLSKKDFNTLKFVDPWDIPEYQRARLNIFRLGYHKFKLGLANVFYATNSWWGMSWMAAKQNAAATLRATGVYGVLVAVAYIGINKTNDFTDATGWKVAYSREATVPGHPDWLKHTKVNPAPSDFGDWGFKASVLAKGQSSSRAESGNHP